VSSGNASLPLADRQFLKGKMDNLNLPSDIYLERKRGGGGDKGRFMPIPPYVPKGWGKAVSQSIQRERREGRSDAFLPTIEKKKRLECVFSLFCGQGKKESQHHSIFDFISMDRGIGAAFSSSAATPRSGGEKGKRVILITSPFVFGPMRKGEKEEHGGTMIFIFFSIFKERGGKKEKRKGESCCVECPFTLSFPPGVCGVKLHSPPPVGKREGGKRASACGCADSE